MLTVRRQRHSSGDHRESRLVSGPIPTRRAPAEMRLYVPRHVVLSSIALGAATTILGAGYAAGTVYRRPELEDRSLVAVLEHPLGWVMVVLGAWVVLAALLGVSRASAHGLAAVAHGLYLVAIAATFVLAYPFQSIVGVALAIFGFVAHGGACLAYWERGYR